jgi:protein required for attachment to host cells
MTVVREAVVEKPEYSDREGFYQASGGGKELNSGSVEKDSKQIKREDFIKAFVPACREVAGTTELERLYLFAPATTLPSLQEHLPTTLLTKLTKTIAGNYVKMSPIELVEKCS